MQSTIDAMSSLPEVWKNRSKFRAKSTAMRVLELLTRMAIVTADVLATELGVSKQAAHVALDQLVQRRIVRLRERTGRKQTYAAEELISVLARDFGTDVKTALEHGYRSLSVTELK